MCVPHGEERLAGDRKNWVEENTTSQFSGYVKLLQDAGPASAQQAASLLLYTYAAPPSDLTAARLTYPTA